MKLFGKGGAFGRARSTAATASMLAAEAGEDEEMQDEAAEDRAEDTTAAEADVEAKAAEPSDEEMEEDEEDMAAEESDEESAQSASAALAGVKAAISDRGVSKAEVANRAFAAGLRHAKAIVGCTAASGKESTALAFALSGLSVTAARTQLNRLPSAATSEDRLDKAMADHPGPQLGAGGAAQGGGKSGLSAAREAQGERLLNRA
ncbi:hypothetical protein [Adonisia turfae]